MAITFEKEKVKGNFPVFGEVSAAFFRETSNLQQIYRKALLLKKALL